MIHLRFLSPWPPALVLACAFVLAGLAWWLYRRELKPLSSIGYAAWLLPLLRAAAILLITLTLAEPILESRKREGEPGRVVILLDASQSMSVDDAPSTSTPSTTTPITDAARRRTGNRFERAVQELIHPNQGLLTQLATDFEVSVQRFGGSPDAAEASPTVRLWESSVSEVQALPTSASEWLPPAWASDTAVGDSLSGALELVSNAEQAASSVVVLMSDGQSNSGESPVAAAEALSNTQTPIFSVGYGLPQEPMDLALGAIEAPQRVYRTDSLRGTLQITDRLPGGTPFTAELLHGDRVVWQQQLLAEGLGQRNVEFEVSVEPLFEAESQGLAHGAEYANLPLKLVGRVRTQAHEGDSGNNSSALFLTVASQKSRLLLIDGRSRWETRYLRNLFARDPAWDTDVVLAHTRSESDEPAGEHAELPSSREAFQKYNLVILGDAPAGLWSVQRMEWLIDFVERGGGLIVIDGAREHLRESAYGPLAPLLPVRWTNDDAQSVDREVTNRVQLTAVGASLPALQLASNTLQDNAQLWRDLPALQFLSTVEALPGSETLVEAFSDPAKKKRPLLLTRRFGAGRVVFVASDETWRWRYKVADVVHTRLWNQIARWAMRIPMSIQSEYVSLDTGPANVAVGQAVEVKCSLRDLNGSLASGRIVTAIVRREDQIVARVPLAENSDMAGTYSAEIRSLPAGDYQVQLEAAGYPQDVLQSASKFSVVAAPSQEMLLLACNEALLRQLASLTAGKYFSENDTAGMVDLLRPLSGGRITQSSTLLWQSYWWFVAALALLMVEWILRKRNGLI